MSLLLLMYSVSYINHSGIIREFRVKTITNWVMVIILDTREGISKMNTPLMISFSREYQKF